MCGMISDTLNLTSPTTTDVDRALMAELSALSGIDPAALASEIFSVGSPLLTMTPDEAVTADSKEYEHGSNRYTVAQIEELSFAPFNAKREALLEALEDLRAAKGYLFAALLITDINTQNSILLVRGDQLFHAPHRLSRGRRTRMETKRCRIAQEAASPVPYRPSSTLSLES